MMKAFKTTFTALLALTGASSAFAATPLQLTSDVYVERQIERADGSKKVTLEKPTMDAGRQSRVCRQI